MNDEVNQIPPKALCGFIQMDVCKYFLQRVSLPCICSALILEKKKILCGQWRHPGENWSAEVPLSEWNLLLWRASLSFFFLKSYNPNVIYSYNSVSTHALISSAWLLFSVQFCLHVFFCAAGELFIPVLLLLLSSADYVISIEKYNFSVFPSIDSFPVLTVH